MKKIVLVLLVIFLVNISFVNAQTNKWRVIMGVSSVAGLSGSGPNFLSIGYSTTKKTNTLTGTTEPDDKISLNVMPRFGICIFNNFAIGADICVGFNSQTDAVTQTGYQQSILAGGPFVRYYIPTQKVRPFIECNYIFGSESTSYDNSTYPDAENSFTSYGAGAGIAFRIGEKSTFDLMATYNMSDSKPQTNNLYNSEAKSTIFGLKFGFTFYLGSEPEF
jgi:hypothetical protein